MLASCFALPLIVSLVFSLSIALANVTYTARVGRNYILPSGSIYGKRSDPDRLLDSNSDLNNKNKVYLKTEELFESPEVQSEDVVVKKTNYPLSGSIFGKRSPQHYNIIYSQVPPLESIEESTPVRPKYLIFPNREFTLENINDYPNVGSVFGKRSTYPISGSIFGKKNNKFNLLSKEKQYYPINASPFSKRNAYPIIGSIFGKRKDLLNPILKKILYYPVSETQFGQRFEASEEDKIDPQLLFDRQLADPQSEVIFPIEENN